MVSEPPYGGPAEVRLVLTHKDADVLAWRQLAYLLKRAGRDLGWKCAKAERGPGLPVWPADERDAAEAADDQGDDG